MNELTDCLPIPWFLGCLLVLLGDGFCCTEGTFTGTAEDQDRLSACMLLDDFEESVKKTCELCYWRQIR